MPTSFFGKVNIASRHKRDDGAPNGQRRCGAYGLPELSYNYHDFCLALCHKTEEFPSL